MRYLLALAVLPLLVAGCDEKKIVETTPLPPNAAPKTEPADAAAPEAEGDILIGEVGSLSGAEATFGDSTHKGIELALKQINAKGGVKGRKLAVKVLDDQGRPEEAATAMTRLITGDKVVLVLGEVASTRSIAMAAVAENHKVPMISHASTNPKVTEGNSFVFRVCFIDPFQGYVMAKFARETLKINKVAILKDVRNDYSIGLAQAFVARFKAMGGTIAKEESYSAGDKDFKAQLASIRAAAPEAIYVPGYYGDVGLVARQAKRMELTVPLLGGDGWSSEKLYEIGAEAIEGSYYSNHYSTQDPSPRIQEFVAEFRSAYNAEPDCFAALGYDAMRVAANAIARAKTLSGPDLRDAVAATKDFDGVTGSITLDAKHNATKPAVVLKVEGGKSVYQTTIAPEK
jgi:branched-chain amino acid transport system substrate-binding protein